MRRSKEDGDSEYELKVRTIKERREACHVIVKWTKVYELCTYNIIIYHFLDYDS